MAGYQRCISLALLCLLLCHDSLLAEAYASKACIVTRGSFQTFKERHFIDETPGPGNWWDQKLGVHDDWVPRSFLKTNAEARVKAVCSDMGGRQYTPEGAKGDHLCISKEKFTFYFVRKGNPTMQPFYMSNPVTKHLILGCSKEGLACLPTHFEPNYEEVTHDAWPNGCQSGKKE